MTQIQNFGQSFLGSLNQAVGVFLQFIPALLGAAIILAIGWLIGKVVYTLVSRFLQIIGMERASARSGISGFIARSGSSLTMSRLVAELARWFVFLVFVQAAATILGIPQLTAIINSVILFLPKLVVAVVILVVGALLANFLAALVRGSLTTMKTSGNVEFLASFTRISVIAFSFIAALSHLGIAPVVVNTLFIGLIAGIALAIGLSFGLGGREVAGELTRRWAGRTGSGAPQALKRPGEDRAA